jgi:2-polyprenyl-3-methyl-5-hydroxy-6-metoxy-1,4-benzoquinol methylase
MVMPEQKISRFSNRTHSLKDLSDLNLNKTLYNQEHKTSKQVYEPFLEVIADLVAKNKYRKILDFGCGTGLVGHFLRESFDADKLELTGVDISEVALERSKPFYDHLYMKDDCTLPEDQYDLVVLNSVLEHIYDSNLRILFSEIKTKLSPNGTVFIVVPNIIIFRISNFLQKVNNTDKTDIELGHVNMKTKKKWKHLIKGFGFSNIRFSYFLFLKKQGRLEYYQNKFLNNVLKAIINIYLFPPFSYLRNTHYITLKR